MTVFRSRGFDSIIGKGMFVRGELHIEPNSTLVIEGNAQSTAILTPVHEGKVDAKTTLRVSGKLLPVPGDDLKITIHNVIITGHVECDEIRCEGTLAVKSGAVLKATKILYRKLIVETGAVMHGQMLHLDHVSEGEQI